MVGTLRREIKEEHRIWRFNTLVLYDLIMSHTLEWPSLTVQWLPGIIPGEDGVTGQAIIIGTHTCNDEPNYVLIVEVSLPNEALSPDGMHYDQQQDYSGFSFGDAAQRKFSINSRIPHEGEVNKVLYNPSNITKIATKAVSGDVYLFDSTKFGPFVAKGARVRMDPELTMKGHTAEGWGLSWNPIETNRLASVADDGYLCLWDIRGYTARKQLKPLLRFSNHSIPMQDVAWIQDGLASHVCVAVSDGGNMLVWDVREENRTFPTQTVSVSDLPVTSVSSNPLKPNTIATGGADQDIGIWDMRRLVRPLHRISSHQEAVIRLQWAGYRSNLLASASSDRFVTIWDLDRVGMEQMPEDAENGPPELIFTHGGHTAPVSDFSWNPETYYPWMIASVAEDNVLQIWQPSKKVFQQQEFESDVEGSQDDFEVE